MLDKLINEVAVERDEDRFQLRRKLFDNPIKYHCAPPNPMLVSEFHTPVRRAHGGSGVRVGTHQIAPLIDLDEGRFELTLTQFQHQGLESLDSNMFDPLVNVSQLEFANNGTVA